MYHSAEYFLDDQYAVYFIYSSYTNILMVETAINMMPCSGLTGIFETYIPLSAS